MKTQTEYGKEGRGMEYGRLFETALGITAPWHIERIEFDKKQKQLDIHISFQRGATFPSASEEGQYKAHDTKSKTWRHLNFFEHECYLHCRTPRIKTESGIELVSPPWAGKANGFTLLFEALVIELCRHMPVKCVSGIVSVTDDRLWRLLDKYVEGARAEEDLSELRSIGMDETSRAKYHQYVTLFVDLKENRTVFVAEGKGHETVLEFAADLADHGGDPLGITEVSCDMSPAFIKGVTEVLPAANITFDKFHIIKLINTAVDEVRREEVATHPVLKRARYVVLKNNGNLTEHERAKLEEISLSKLNLKTVRALRIRESFQDIYNASDEETFEVLLKKWYFWATHSRLEPIVRVAKTIKAHWDGILEWKRSQINNGILEGLNSVVQAAKAKARGFKTFKNFKIVVYLTTGKLNFGSVNSHCK